VLRVDYAASAISWEAMLYLAGGRPRRPGELRIQRDQPDARRRPVRPFTGETKVLSWVEGPAEVELARVAWQPLAEDSRFLHTISNSYELRARYMGSSQLPLRDEIQVLHLVGEPIETTGGVRFRSLGGARNVRGADLLHMDEVVRLFPKLQLCVLQASPLHQPQRTIRDRAGAAMLRTLAAELYGLGVSAVVTVPPLRTHDGELVVRLLAELLAAHHPNPFGRLPTTLAAAQAQLVAAAEDDEQTLEAALDICLYLTRSRDDGR
jgi:hypothetical protein